MLSETTEKIRIEIEKTLAGKPHIFRSDKTRQAIDGCSPGVMANFDCAGTGPSESFLVGRKIAYEKNSYIDWVLARIETPDWKSRKKGAES